MFDPDQAAAMTGAGADVLVPHDRYRRFFGASSMEWLPTERAIAGWAAAFKGLRPSRTS